MDFIRSPLTLAILSVTFSGIPSFALAQDEQVDAWDKAMDIIPEFVQLGGSSYTSGGSLNTTSIAKAGNRHYSLPAGQANLPSKPGATGGASLGYSIGCDGVNFSNIVNSKMDQFTDGMAAFAKNAPAMTVMWIAYSDPTLKSVMDGLDLSANFGLDISNMNCSAGKRLAQTNNFNDWAEAASVTECENEDGVCYGDGWASKLSETKKDITSSIANYSKGMLSSARNSAAYQKASQLTSNASGKAGELNSALAGITSKVPTASCESVSELNDKSALRIFLSESELSCKDAAYVVELLPDYIINDELELELESSQTLEVNDWYQAMVKELIDTLQKLRSKNKTDFDTALAGFVNRTQLIFTDNEYQKLLEFSVQSYGTSGNNPRFDAFVSELAHESSLMIMRSSLRRFERNLMRSTFKKDDVSQEDPMIGIKNTYLDRIHVASNEIDSIESIFNDSAKVKSIISSLPE